MKSTLTKHICVLIFIWFFNVSCILYTCHLTSLFILRRENEFSFYSRWCWELRMAEVMLHLHLLESPSESTCWRRLHALWLLHSSEPPRLCIISSHTLWNPTNFLRPMEDSIFLLALFEERFSASDVYSTQ